MPVDRKAARNAAIGLSIAMGEIEDSEFSDAFESMRTYAMLLDTTLLELEASELNHLDVVSTLNTALASGGVAACLVCALILAERARGNLQPLTTLTTKWQQEYTTDVLVN